MRYNAWDKRPPVQPERTREFTLQGGETLTLWLRKMSTVQQTQVYEVGTMLKQRYITGDDEFVESKGKSGEGPIGFPPIGGVVLPITETMITSACIVHAMQSHDPDALEIEDWIAFQLVEEQSDWIAIQSFVGEVNRIGKPSDSKAADVPNSSGAGTRESSDPSLANTVRIQSYHAA